MIQKDYFLILQEQIQNFLQIINNLETKVWLPNIVSSYPEY